ncbi:MAG TPA: SRPBCC family protein [Acidimicrobiales bacterium]|nr:SRPBCC family protein [Acidimicrobiales bacterium]
MSASNRDGPGAAKLPGSITTERRYELPLGPEAVWALIADVGAYQSWWSWLRIFDGQGLTAGDEWRCEVQPPLPYPVRFRVLIDQVAAPTTVHARVEGDVVGTAVLTLEETEAGCTACLTSSLAPGNATLRLVSRLAAPIARFGHDWVLDSGARQFVARAVTPTLAD